MERHPPKPNVARLNADGSLDTALTRHGGDDAVISSCVQPDGKIIALAGLVFQ